MNQTTSILNQKLSIPENVLAQELNGEMVLLKIDSESYYSLNPVGSRIWQLLTEQENVENAMQQFSQIYAVDETQQANVTIFINELLDEGLLQATEDQKVGKARKEPIESHSHNLLPYELPKLIKHGTIHDMTLSTNFDFGNFDGFFDYNDIS